MANTYTQIHIQVVFAVQGWQSKIKNEWKEELFKYITGIVKNKGHKLLQINGMADHVHILIGLRPNHALSDLVKIVKQDSSKWINNRGFLSSKFSWQAGFGAFSYSKSEVKNVINYIQNQEVHHQTKSFIEEYTELLDDFEIEFDNRYIFKKVE